MTRSTHTLITIQPDGSELRVFTSTDYGTLKSAVGGLIETIPSFKFPNHKRCTAYVDESGRLKNLPLNQKASELWKNSFPKGTAFRFEPRIYGPMIVVVKGNHVS